MLCLSSQIVATMSDIKRLSGSTNEVMGKIKRYLSNTAESVEILTTKCYVTG